RLELWLKMRGARGRRRDAHDTEQRGQAEPRAGDQPTDPRESFPPGYFVGLTFRRREAECAEDEAEGQRANRGGDHAAEQEKMRNRVHRRRVTHQGMTASRAPVG